MANTTRCIVKKINRVEEEEECLRLRVAEIISHDVERTKQCSGGNLSDDELNNGFTVKYKDEITNRLPYGVDVYIVYIIPNRCCLLNAE